MTKIEFRPIGIIHSPFGSPTGMPIQPAGAEGVAGHVEIFAEFQQHLAETSPWIWLYSGYTYTAAQPYVTGWTPNASDALYFLNAVHVDK